MSEHGKQQVLLMWGCIDNFSEKFSEKVPELPIATILANMQYLLFIVAF